MGGGIESTSHKHGLFQYICRRFEMVMADGSVVSCTSEDKAELFSALPFSYGTLGFLTAVDLDIIPFKPFMRLRYLPVHSLEEAVEVFKRETVDSDADSVEGIMFTREKGVIMSGHFMSQPGNDAPINKLGRWFKPWFHHHVKAKLEHQESAKIEYIPTYDFFHRHNRSTKS
jgi:delta24-sterol reductase